MNEQKRRAKQIRAVGGLALASPRWWPTWVGVGTLWLLAQAPWPLQRALGLGIGRVLLACARERRRVTAINLEICFPEHSEEERRRLLRRNFQELGVSIFQMASAWWGSLRRLRDSGYVTGREHVDAAQAKGRGVILLQGHFLATDLGGQRVGMEMPITTTYAEPKNPVIRHLTTKLRARFLAGQLHHSRVRDILRELQANHIIWHGPDQSPPRKTAVETTFIGHPVLSSVSTAKLARASGAAVVPFLPFRGADGRYDFRFEPALEDFPGPDVTAATQRVNDVIERHIREAPDQYLWAHKRFKRSAGGTGDPYT